VSGGAVAAAVDRDPLRLRMVNVRYRYFELTSYLNAKMSVKRDFNHVVSFE
jgi:hypothetical protein